MWDSMGASMWDSMGASMWILYYINWKVFFMYAKEVLNINFNLLHYNTFINIVNNTPFLLPYQNICIVSRKPIEISYKKENMKRKYTPLRCSYDKYILHGDGKPAVKYKDGFTSYILNSQSVPKWLAMTPTSLLKSEQYLELENANVKREFIKKFGIDRMKSLGKVIDTWENYKNHINYEWMKKSKYELIDMGIMDKVGYIPYLGMINQTTGTYHLEAVKEGCKTIPEAFTNTRWNGKNFNKIKITNIK